MVAGVSRALDTQVADVGRRVAELRAGRSWTQEQFAERAGRSVQWVRRIESGANLTLRTFFRLAQVLDVRVVALLSRPARKAPRRGRPPKPSR